MEPLIILLAFASGLFFRRIGYPAMPGYLLAGFIAHGLGLGDANLIAEIADIGILLLLFTIGLKLNVRDVLAPQVWAVAGLQMLIAVPLTTIVIIAAGMLFPILVLQDTTSAWTLAFALSFSSTVFAVKIFEDRGESAAFHARITIGILVIQDILAVAFLVLSAETLPSAWALALPLIILTRPVVLRLLSVVGHSELVVLLGLAAALGGAELFEALHLKGGLGALLLGLMLSGSPQTKELYRHMIGLKDLFLIGFFLQIGYYGLPTEHMSFVALGLCIVILIRPLIYFLLFVAFRLRARTSLLASSALFNYSEFGLVVAAFAVSDGTLPAEWLTTIAIAVSVSFFIATPLNTQVHRIYSRYGSTLQKLERSTRIKEEVPSDLGDAEVVVLGMGRVGRGAYERLSEISSHRIVGVDEDLDKVESLRQTGFNCVHGDASDYDFWAHSGLGEKKLVLISLTNHEENLLAVELSKKLGFKSDLAVVSRFPDELDELNSLGCIAFNLYGEAGHGFAEHIADQLNLTAKTAA